MGDQGKGLSDGISRLVGRILVCSLSYFLSLNVDGGGCGHGEGT